MRALQGSQDLLRERKLHGQSRELRRFPLLSTRGCSFSITVCTRTPYCFLTGFFKGAYTSGLLLLVSAQGFVRSDSCKVGATGARSCRQNR